MAGGDKEMTQPLASKDDGSRSGRLGQEEKHTPGPWEALEWERENGGKDWNVWGPKGSNHLGNPNLQGDFGSEADARLIAAAPDLLEALLKWQAYDNLAEEDFSDINSLFHYAEAIEATRAAILKATSSLQASETSGSPTIQQ